MTVKDLKKENEILKRELRQLNEDRHRLQVEYITTMNQLLRPNDPRSVVNRFVLVQSSFHEIIDVDSMYNVLSLFHFLPHYPHKV